MEGLGRVLTRLALTEDDKLEQVGGHCLAAAVARRCYSGLSLQLAQEATADVGSYKGFDRCKLCSLLSFMAWVSSPCSHLSSVLWVLPSLPARCSPACCPL